MRNSKKFIDVHLKNAINLPYDLIDISDLANYDPDIFMNKYINK